MRVDKTSKYTIGILAILYLIAAITFWNEATAAEPEMYSACYKGTLEGYHQNAQESYMPAVDRLETAIYMEYRHDGTDSGLYLERVAVAGWAVESCSINRLAPVQATAVCVAATADYSRVDTYHLVFGDNGVRLFVFRVTDGFVGDVDVSAVASYEGVVERCGEEAS